MPLIDLTYVVEWLMDISRVMHEQSERERSLVVFFWELLGYFFDVN